MRKTSTEIKEASSKLRDDRRESGLKPCEINWEAYLLESPANLVRRGLEQGIVLHAKAVAAAVELRQTRQPYNSAIA